MLTLATVTWLGDTCTVPVPSAQVTVTSGVIPAYWRTRAERTGYRLTSDYEETMRYCRQLEAGSRWIKLTSYGVSGQGRG